MCQQTQNAPTKTQELYVHLLNSKFTSCAAQQEHPSALSYRKYL